MTIKKKRNLLDNDNKVIMAQGNDEMKKSLVPQQQHRASLSASSPQTLAMQQAKKCNHHRRCRPTSGRAALRRQALKRRRAALVRRGQSATQEQLERWQRRQISTARNTPRLRPGLESGTVLILLASRHRGRRVVCLGALQSGLLLITGPYSVNGVPLRRVHPNFVISTATRLPLRCYSSTCGAVPQQRRPQKQQQPQQLRKTDDDSTVVRIDVAKFTDAYFAKDAKSKRRRQHLSSCTSGTAASFSSASWRDEEPLHPHHSQQYAAPRGSSSASIFISRREELEERRSKSAMRLSEERIADQTTIDALVLAAIRRLPNYRLFIKYLQSFFTLRNNMFPHRMTF